MQNEPRVSSTARRKFSSETIAQRIRAQIVANFLDRALLRRDPEPVGSARIELASNASSSSGVSRGRTRDSSEAINSSRVGVSTP